MAFRGVLPATTQTGWLSTPLQMIPDYTPQAGWSRLGLSSSGPRTQLRCRKVTRPLDRS